MTPKDVVAMAKEKGLRIIDLKFVDLFGQWQHFSIPDTELKEEIFSEGVGFDGSSIRGFQKIHESDMLLFPDPDTAIVDPVCKVPTMSITCNVVDPVKMADYTRDPRFVARKAEKHLKSTGIADTSYWGPECEFYVFNDVRFEQTTHSGYYYIDADEGIWNSGVSNGKPNLGHRPRYKEGYFPVPPVDSLQDLRSKMILSMMDSGIPIEVQHHEVGTAGQAEIDMRYQTLTRMADQVMLYKYIVKNVAKDNGYTATFMPKPLFQDNGSGMHVHSSLWKDGKPLFFDEGGYGMISELCRHYIGGLLEHAPALLAILAPSTNSYRRLVPGYEAPINLVYSARNRSACARIPMISKSPAAKRVEFRCPDPSANPYLAFTAILMAGLDGIERGIEPPAPIDEDLYELPPEEKAHVKSTPGSLPEVLNCLEADHEFLLKGNVFTRDLLENYVAFKREQVDQVALRPHPYEFHLYYDV